jgi:hypothetical protein
MSNCPFCNLDPAPKPGEGNRPTGFLSRAWRSLQWLFPTTLLVLMPKCPLCVAAYVALFTGMGISVATARWIQILMLVFCLTSLAYLVFRKWRQGQARLLR